MVRDPRGKGKEILEGKSWVLKGKEKRKAIEGKDKIIKKHLLRGEGGQTNQKTLKGEGEENKIYREKQTTKGREVGKREDFLAPRRRLGVELHPGGCGGEKKKRIRGKVSGRESSFWFTPRCCGGKRRTSLTETQPRGRRAREESNDPPTDRGIAGDSL